MRRILFVGLVLTSACLGNITPSPVASLIVSSNLSASGEFVGDQIQINASALDITGAPVPAAVSYTTSDASIAIVSTTGTVSALAPGKVTITIQAGGQTDHLAFTVDANVSTTVQISPTNPVIATGSHQLLTATVFTALGNPARNKTVVWSTADATKVSVDQSGNITGVAPTTSVAVCAAAGDAPTIKVCTTVVVQ